MSFAVSPVSLDSTILSRVYSSLIQGNGALLGTYYYQTWYFDVFPIPGSNVINDCLP